MKKKITVVFLAILILFNFIYCNFVYAEETTTMPITQNTGATPTTPTTTTTTSPKEQLQEFTTPKDGSGPIDLTTITAGIMDDISSSTSTITNGEDANSKAGSTKKMDMQKYVKNSYGSTGGIIAGIWAFIVGNWLNNIPQVVVEATGSEVKNNQFTIYDLVIGHYSFFNLDFYNAATGDNLQEDSQVDSKDANTNTTNNLKKESLGANIIANVYVFYYRLRNISLALSLFVLMYIAIRMAISTTSIQRAKYKDMLMAWFTSVAILFFMHYIIIILSYVTHLALEFVEQIAEAWKVENIEGNILSGQLDSLERGSPGFHGFQMLIMVTAFVYYEIKFLIAYIKRFCEMLFLIIISPLVTVTYAIDKVGDNKAQAFSTWFKELSTKYAIQVVHAITYIIFIAAAGEIAQTIPLLAIFFLWALGRAEITIRKVVGLQDADHVQKAKPPRLKGLPKFLQGRRGKS